MASQFGNLPPGAAPFGPRPSTPRGLYREFGAPERLLRIHFPSNQQNPGTSNPWYWFYTRQQPMAFSFLFTKWVRAPFFPVIKILQSDTQPLVPIPLVGATSLEDAVTNKVSQADESWGRIDFRDERFWSLVTDDQKGHNKGMPAKKPAFDQHLGLIQARDSKTNINKIIKQAATQFQNDWNGEADAYNRLAAGVGPNGFHYPGQPSLFDIPPPDGPPTTISRFEQQLDAFTTTPPGPAAAFLGPLPGTAFFNINTITTSAYAFTLRVAQLDPKRWNMGEFPPLDSTIIGNGSASALSKDYSGFGATNFPFAGPSVV